VCANCAFRWFAGSSINETVWDHSAYSKNRERILHSDFAVMFMRSSRSQVEAAGPSLGDHFTVDGLLSEPWALFQSFRPKDQEPPVATGGNRNPEWISN
jgi:hypothetical protein